MLRRTRSQTKLCSSSPRRRSRRELEDESEGKENLPTPPSTPKRKKTNSPPQTPQNIRHITKELEKTQVSKPALKKDETPPTPTKEIPKANQESNAQEKQQIPITARAKALFRRTAIPSRLVARDNERQTMTDFWQTHVIGNQPGSLYVSGSPGTGKTAMLMDIMRKSQDELDNLSTHKVQTVMINCMSVGEPKQIYAKLVTELKGPKTALSNDPVQQAHQLLLAKKNTLSVVVLDEIDHLITKDQDVLYRLFEWASQPESRLVLIGIANALDLTDRLLPRLRAKGCEPCLLNFSPYTVKEVTEIIQDRLYSLVDAKDRTGELPLMHQKAVELCARKVAAGMGDLRTALDMCRQAIELAEAEYNKKAVLTDQSSNGAREAPRVTIVHMSRAQRSMFGNPTIMKLKQLNLQQKAALVVLVVMSRTGKKDTITLGKFREQHTTLWKKFEGIPSLSHTELNDVLAMIEANGFITVGNSREERTRRIHLNIQESEVLQMAREIEVLNLWVNEILQE